MKSVTIVTCDMTGDFGGTLLYVIGGLLKYIYIYLFNFLYIIIYLFFFIFGANALHVTCHICHTFS